MSAARRYEARTFHLTVDDVNKFSKSGPRRNFEFHDINPYAESRRSQVARSEGHGYDTFIMSNIESQGRVYSRSCLGKESIGRLSIKQRHTQYGFPVSVAAKVMASVGTPRFLSKTLGRRLPMSDPWMKDQASVWVVPVYSLLSCIRTTSVFAATKFGDLVLRCLIN